MDRSARDGGTLEAWPSGVGEARRADRSRPSRSADPAQLRRQKYPYGPRRARAGAAFTARGGRRAQASRSGRDLLDGRVAQGTCKGTRETRVTSILIRRGRVIDPANRVDAIFDLRVSDGKIEELELTRRGGNAGPIAREIDASGCWVVPGLIDPHVHL